MPWSSPIRSLLACSLASLVPFSDDGTHVFVWHVVARVLITLCRLRVARTNVSQVRYGSIVGHHLIDDDLQLFHDFIKLSWSRQELTFDVPQHHLAHYEYLLRLINRFE